MVGPDPGDETGPPSSLLWTVFGPVFALGAFTAILALLAGLFGWHAAEILYAAGGAGFAVVVAALVLLHRQRGERKAADTELRSARARVADIIESAMDAIVAVDDEQRILLYNGAAEKVFRWPREAVMGRRLDMLIPERLRGAHRNHIEQFGAEGVTKRRMSTVLAGLRANGEEFPIEASISQHNEDGGKIYTVILRDITERIAAEDRLARSEARLAGILDSAMDSIITVDENQRIVLFNRAAEQVFGYPKEEALGAPLSRLLPQRYRTAHEENVREFGRTGKSSRHRGELLTVAGLRKNGEEFPADASISQISQGGVKLYTVILRDVTARVRAEEALQRSREELRELAQVANSTREEEKTRIARELHDELAQALTALKMDANWIADRVEALHNEPLTEKLAAMQSTLDDTVAATRRIAADLRPLMLDDLGLLPAVEWLVQNFTERTGIYCHLAVADDEIDLQDPHASAVFRILQESLTNVAKHARASRVDVALDKIDGHIVLSVRDNGIGFSPDAPRKPDSFGLMGLRERAYALGGEVSIQSEPEQGTRIEVRIPVTEEARQE